jgi:hypothetical protein
MTPASRAILLAAAVTLTAPVVGLEAQSARDLKPFRSTVYNVAFGYPKKDWIPVPAAGGNIALVMHKKGEASLALDYQVLRVPLAPDEIDETFLEIEVEALGQRAPHARIVDSELTDLNGRKTVVIHYGAAGLTGDLDVTQYSVVDGAALYRLTCAVARSRISRHGGVCELAAQSLAINDPS